MQNQADVNGSNRTIAIGDSCQLCDPSAALHPYTDILQSMSDPFNDERGEDYALEITEGEIELENSVLDFKNPASIYNSLLFNREAREKDNSF